ncbi:hypothetical protein C4565_06775 [Candidatus Parcubacteria bacterium]|nr:MAG: hypothetical protein C4565_06775 [Candidatus Parcubacteria bacterium]
MLNSYKFVDYPRAKYVHQYDDARKRMIDFLYARPDVKSLYEFGSVGAPGLSDLDLAVVLDAKPKEDISEYLSVRNIPPSVNQMMDGGTLMVFKSKDFVDIMMWDDVNLNLLHGSEHSVRKLSEDEEKQVELCRVVDWVPDRCSRLIEVIKTKYVPVQRTVGYLNSTVHSLKRIIRILGQSDVTWDSFITTVNKIRASWFNYTMEEQQEILIEAVFSGINVSFSALTFFGEYCANKHLYSNYSVSNAYLKIKDTLEFRFVDLKYVSSECALTYSRPMKIVIPVPDLFYQHFLIYGSVDGRIGNVLNKNISQPFSSQDRGRIAPELNTVLVKRMTLANSMAQFLYENKFKRGLFKFGWYYVPPDDSEENGCQCETR